MDFGGFLRPLNTEVFWIYVKLIRGIDLKNPPIFFTILSGYDYLDNFIFLLFSFTSDYLEIWRDLLISLSLPQFASTFRFNHRNIGRPAYGYAAKQGCSVWQQCRAVYPAFHLDN